MLRRLLNHTAVRRLAGIVPDPARRRFARALGLWMPEDPAVEALRRDVDRRLRAAALDHDRAWRAVRTRSEWERFRDDRIEALRRSLGPLPAAGSTPDVRVTGARLVEGVIVENVVFAGPPGLWATANLYRPERPARRAPGIVICHSHHADRTEGELQDMGVLWARGGCTVVVPGLIGHGERRLHPFRSAADYRLPYKVARQDYYFRFNLGMQLHLAGHSLIGWMAGDVVRALDVLLARPEVDPERVVLIGAVAGGGDIAAVVAALDRRVRGLVAFGVRGDVVVPDRQSDRAAAVTVPGPGRGSWESTRNLRCSARDGFFPWVVLAAQAPRHLVYAHEFAWDAAEDPVWTRLGEVYELYGVPDRLAAIHGRGSVAGRPPANTHCTNVGEPHRRPLHPILERWFGIPPPDESRRARSEPAELACLDDGARPRNDALGVLATEADVETAVEVARLRRDLEDVLGTEPGDGDIRRASVASRDGEAEIVRLETADRIELELALRFPSRERSPVVVGFCQQGWRALDRARRRSVTALLRAGIAVCLTDLRATGPARTDAVRGRHGAITEVAASELMLGRTMLGRRLADLRSVLRYVRDRPEVDPARLGLWGDSLASVNAAGRDLAVPFDAGVFPELGEPLGGLVALVGGVLDDRIVAVRAGSALLRLAGLLESPFCYVPADIVVPGILEVCDVDDLAAAIAPRPLSLERPIDGLNRAIGRDRIDAMLPRARRAYDRAGASDNLRVTGDRRFFENAFGPDGGE